MADTANKSVGKKAAQKATKAKKPNIFKRIAKYFRDLRSETKKIVWPTKKQSLNNTGIVLIVVIISALLLTVLDLAFGWSVKGLLDLASTL